MPRNYIQKQFTETEVIGYLVEDGLPKLVSFSLPHKCESVTRTQGLIRKQYPSFSVSELKPKTTTYRMSFEDFKALAIPVEEGDEDE